MSWSFKKKIVQHSFNHYYFIAFILFEFLLTSWLWKSITERFTEISEKSHYFIIGDKIRCAQSLNEIGWKQTNEKKKLKEIVQKCEFCF